MMMKIKHPKFGEGVEPKPKPDHKSPEGNMLCAWVLSLVNENRIMAATSKIGSLKEKRNWNDIGA